MKLAPSSFITTRPAWPHLAEKARKARHDEVVAAFTRAEKPEWVRRIEAAHEVREANLEAALTLSASELLREHRGW